MATLAEILTDNGLFVHDEQLEECLADQPEWQQVGDAAVGEDGDLDLDREVPRRCRR